MKNLIFVILMFMLCNFDSYSTTDSLKKPIFEKKYCFFVEQIKKRISDVIKDTSKESFGVSYDFIGYHNYLKEYLVDLKTYYYIKNIDKLLLTLSNFKCDLDTSKDQYKKFIKYLRKSIATTYFQNTLQSNRIPEIAEPTWIVYSLVQIMYTEINMAEWGDHLVNVAADKIVFDEFQNNTKEIERDNLYGIFLSALMKMETVSPELKQRTKKYSKNAAKKLPQNIKRSHAFHNFDVHKEGNFPSIKFVTQRFNENKNILNIRMGTQTYGKSNRSGEKIELFPEFKVFLKILESQEKNHLYINYQYRKKLPLRYLGLGNEDLRSEALEKSNYLESSLTVMTLDKNSLFYLQKGKYKDNNLNFTQKLKSKLIEDSNSAFYIPITFRNEKFVDKVISFVSNNFFRKTKKGYFDYEKDYKKRRIFLDLYYIVLTQKILSNYDSYNRTCKDGIDRGGSENSLEFLFLLLTSLSKDGDQIELNESIKRFPNLIFTDALLARNRKIKSERYERFIITSKYLIKQFSEKPHLGQKIIEFTGITGVKFLK